MNNWFETGHVAIVTGGSRGLGKAVAAQLVERGVHAIIDGRDRAVLEAAALELRTFGPVTAIAGDLADDAHVHALIAAAREIGRLDLVINNASTLGAVPLPAVEALQREVFERLFAVNVFAPMHLVQHALPLMRASNGRCTIVNITSDAGVEAYPAWGGYGASKAALEHLSRVLGAELEGDRVHILAADPGDMNTQMHRDAVPNVDPATLRDPAEAARALLDAIAGMRKVYERVNLSAVVSA